MPRVLFPARHTFLVGLQLPRKRHNIAHKNKTPREIVTGKRMPFKDIKGMAIGMICWGHEHKDIRPTASSPKARQGFWAGFDPLSSAHLIYLPFTHQLLVCPTVSGGASTFYGDMFGLLSDIRSRMMRQARYHSEDNWRNLTEQIRRSDQLQKEHRRAYRDILRRDIAGTEAQTKVLTTARLLDQSSLVMLAEFEKIEKRAAADRKADRQQRAALATMAEPDAEAEDMSDISHENSPKQRRRRVRRGQCKQVPTDSWKNASWDGLTAKFNTISLVEGSADDMDTSAGGAAEKMDTSAGGAAEKMDTPAGGAAEKMDTSAGGAREERKARVSIDGSAARPHRHTTYGLRAIRSVGGAYREQTTESDAGYSPMPAGGAAEKEEFDAEGFNAEVQAHAGRCEHFDFKTLHVIQHLLATGDPEDIVKLKDLDVLSADADIHASFSAMMLES